MPSEKKRKASTYSTIGQSSFILSPSAKSFKFITSSKKARKRKTGRSRLSRQQKRDERVSMRIQQWLIGLPPKSKRKP